MLGVAFDPEGVALIATGGLGGGFGAVGSIGRSVTIFPTAKLEEINGGGYSFGIIGPSKSGTGAELSFDKAINFSTKGLAPAGGTYAGGPSWGAMWYLEYTNTLSTKKQTYKEFGLNVYNALPESMKSRTTPMNIAREVFSTYKSVAMDALNNQIDYFNYKIGITESSIQHNNQLINYYQNRIDKRRGVDGKLSYKYTHLLDKVEDLESQNSNLINERKSLRSDMQNTVNLRNGLENQELR
ncbi:MAG: hypothetical protein OEW75_01245 [Cyclobacteriaceae bacterium]|nr:hypothetical protein [Cyclobacteriaceae bacterium]